MHLGGLQRLHRVLRTRRRPGMTADEIATELRLAAASEDATVA